MGPENPQKIGRYEIRRLIGEGATAAVYKAHDPDIDRTVAIKILKKEFGTDENFSSRFQREAHSAGTISHPNIVTIYDVGRVNGTPYIAMEFLEEESLADLLARGKKIPVRQVAVIGAQLARALDYAHRRGIVHRDVKPANILLIESGRSVKLTDFGIARLAGTDELQRTHLGTVLGTPRYMSPEQAAAREVDGRSDLFSLGAILYELLTGRRAFDDENLALLLMQILHKNPPAPSRVAPQVPGGLERIVMKLLSKRPEQRFQTGSQLAEAMERELQALDEAERVQRQNKFLPMRIRLALIASCALALLFGACMSVVYEVEGRMLRTQVLDSGAALAKFVAVEAALPVLGQNWVPLKLFVADAKARGSFDYLVITDHHGVVEASTDDHLTGTHFSPPRGQTVLSRAAAMTIFSAMLPNQRSAFLFDTPILFENTPIGTIYLGVDQAGTQRVLRATLSLLSLLGLCAVAAVGSLSYFFAGLIARPMRLLRDSLAGFAAGDSDRRISQRRSDEFGELFAAFNHMAESTQRLLAAAALSPPAGAAAPATVPAGLNSASGEHLATLVMPG